MKSYIFIFSYILLFFVEAYAVEINIDASKDTGPVPKIFGSSIWLTHVEKRDEYAFEKFLKENRPTVIHFTIARILRDSNSYTAFQSRLKQYFTSKNISLLTDIVKKKNIKLIVGFDPRPMPSWLSSRSGDSRPVSGIARITIESVSPPQDIQLWKKVVKFTLNFLFKDQNIKNLGFYVGHEPNDREWAGNEEAFFKYYKAAAEAAKEVNKNISVGGIGTWSVEAKKESCEKYSDHAEKICRKEGGWSDPGGEPMIKNFLNYVARHNVPLDFINWHSFRAFPPNLKENASMISDWIKEAGLNRKSIVLFPSDWTFWAMHAAGYPADYLDTEETAAYIINALYNMWVAGIEWAGHDFNVKNPSKENIVRRKRDNSTFIGDWHLVTKDGIIKPSYNSFKTLTKLLEPDNGSTGMINVKQPSDKRVIAVSTINKENNTVKTLISNFTPTDINLFHFYLTAHLKENKSTDIATNLESLIKCVRKKKRDGVKLDEKIISSCLNQYPDKERELLGNIAEGYKCFMATDPERCIKSIISEAEKQGNTELLPVLTYIEDNLSEIDVKVNYQNLAFDGKVSITTYKIDADNSNACRLNKLSEPRKTLTSCGINGLIDKKVRNARQNSKIQAFKEYCSSIDDMKGKEDEIIQYLRKCQSSKNKRDCYKKVQKKFNIQKSDLNKIKELSDIKYSDYIESINEMEGVSFEKSAEKSYKELKDNKFDLTFKMKPNSIILIEIGSD